MQPTRLGTLHQPSEANESADRSGPGGASRHHQANKVLAIQSDSAASRRQPIHILLPTLQLTGKKVGRNLAPGLQKKASGAMFGHSIASGIAARASAVFSGLLLVVATSSAAPAAEIKLLGPASFRVLLPELLPQFAKSSGHQVTAAYAPLGVITDRVSKGELIDVAIVSGKQNEELQKQGKLIAGSRVEIAQVGFTVFVKKGSAKPDISSADALKRALLAAKSIAVGDPARGGGASLYTIDLLKRLGISEEV